MKPLLVLHDSKRIHISLHSTTLASRLLRATPKEQCSRHEDAIQLLRSVLSRLTPSGIICNSNRARFPLSLAMQSNSFPVVEFDRSKLMIRIEVTLNADPTAISPVVEGIMEMARRLECAAGKEFEIETALREALANAIVHGCKNDPTQKVQCCVGCDDERGMLIVVRDPGSGFDPFAIPDPCNGENVFSNHGRGIYLINQLMDEVKFENNGTEIHMRKYPVPR